MKKRAATRATQKHRAAQLVLNQTQVGLALGFLAIGVLLAFGVGFMLGMWYQATERITPYEAEFVPSTKHEAHEPPRRFDTTVGRSTEGETTLVQGDGVTGGEAVRSASEVIPAATEGARSSSGPGYSVQVGSFRARAQAEQLHSRLMQKGYPARIEASQIIGKGVWYRVRVGHFAERAAADRTAQQLVSQEQLSVVVTDALR